MHHSLVQRIRELQEGNSLIEFRNDKLLIRLECDLEPFEELFFGRWLSDTKFIREI